MNPTPIRPRPAPVHRATASRATHAVRAAMFAGCAVVLAGVATFGASRAATLTCGTPKASGGIITVTLKGNSTGKCSKNVTIPAGFTAAQKAEEIAKQLNDPNTGCNVYKVSASGSVVTIDEKVDPSYVVISTSDYTAEKDSIVNGMTAEVSWSDDVAGYAFTAFSAASGGAAFGPATLSVGTSRYQATVPTHAGETALEMVSAAAADLGAHGIPVTFSDIGGGQATLFLHPTTADSFIVVGSSDTTAFYRFDSVSRSDAIEWSGAGATQDLLVPPGTGGVSIAIAPGAPAADGDVTLYGYHADTGAWVIERDWRWTPGLVLGFTPDPQIVHYQLVAHGNLFPLMGQIVLGNPAGNTPNAPPTLPDFSLGWLDASGLEFNGQLGLGGGAPNGIVIQPGLSLNGVPAAVGVNHWQYLPLQINVQPDPSRPWLYVGNNPAAQFAQNPSLQLSLGGLFDISGQTLPSLSIQVDVFQGATQRTFQAQATYDVTGHVHFPAIDLGQLLAQPYGLRIMPLSGGVPHSAAGRAALQSVPGYVTLDAVVVTQAAQGSAAVGDEPPAGAALALAAPAPNPFRSDVTLSFATGQSGHVRVAIYDVAGREVRRIVDTTLEAGVHHTRWDGRDAARGAVSPGVYFARVEGPRDTVTRRMLLVR